MRFPLEVFAAVASRVAQGKPLGVRVSCTDWDDGGWDVDQTVVFARRAQELGCDWIDASSGGLIKNQKIRSRLDTSGFCRARQEGGRHRDRRDRPDHRSRASEKIVAEGKADMVRPGARIPLGPPLAWHAALEPRGDAADSSSICAAPRGSRGRLRRAPPC